MGVLTLSARHLNSQATADLRLFRSDVSRFRKSAFGSQQVPHCSLSSPPRNFQRGFLSCPSRNAACTCDMSAQHQRRPSVRWTREREHQAKSVSPAAARSAAFDAAKFIYGSNPSLQLHRQHLEGVLGAFTNGSLEPATPSDARTHFNKTSRPSRILCLPSVTDGRCAVREQENGGRNGKRLVFSIPPEQHAMDVMRSPPSIPPAARTLKITTTFPPLRTRSEP